LAQRNSFDYILTETSGMLVSALWQASRILRHCNDWWLIRTCRMWFDVMSAADSALPRPTLLCSQPPERSITRRLHVTAQDRRIQGR